MKIELRHEALQLLHDQWGLLGEELREIWDGVQAVDDDIAQMFTGDMQRAYRAAAERSTAQSSQLSDMRDNGQLGQRIRTLAASGHAGDEQDERAYPVEESLRARMRQKTEEFSARALEAQQRYQRYLENCIWAAEDDLAAMQEEDDAYHEDDDD